MKDIYLDFKEANCKNCYKCLRACPVKAIEVTDHQARIIEKRCILCGTCTQVCPQDAKAVHPQKDKALAMLKSDTPVFASVAPSFISSFHASGFSDIKNALKALGFADAFETAEGARAVVSEYERLLKSGDYKNFITSACPAVNRLVQQYYSGCLPFLAEVDTPAIAHAKIIKERYKDCKVVFIGPCIAKKREGAESGVIDCVLTFEELEVIFAENGLSPDANCRAHLRSEDGFAAAAADTGFPEENGDEANRARFFPITRGIIKSFENKPDNYEYISVDGIAKCAQALEGMTDLSGVFLELNACEYGCVNGPCSLLTNSGKLKANSSVRKYAGIGTEPGSPAALKVNLRCIYPRLGRGGRETSEEEIAAILLKTGKTKPSDELNCGACGYDSCRDKAWAVINGYADIEMCLPYMRERAESMSYEIIQNSPNGIIVIDSEFNVVEVNETAKKLWGVTETALKGRPAQSFFDVRDFVLALAENKNITRKKSYIAKTQKYIEATISILEEHKMLFCICKDITEEVNYEKRLSEVKSETFMTTDAVIKKQMRVAQEIASLLGETTAETKVALHRLKHALKEESGGGQI